VYACGARCTLPVSTTNLRVKAGTSGAYSYSFTDFTFTSFICSLVRLVWAPTTGSEGGCPRSYCTITDVLSQINRDSRAVLVDLLTTPADSLGHWLLRTTGAKSSRYGLTKTYLDTDCPEFSTHSKMHEGDNLIPSIAPLCAHNHHYPDSDAKAPAVATCHNTTGPPWSVTGTGTSISRFSAIYISFTLDPGMTARRNGRKLRGSDAYTFVAVSFCTGQKDCVYRHGLCGFSPNMTLVHL
jgi:hypothetical protein